MRYNVAQSFTGASDVMNCGDAIVSQPRHRPGFGNIFFYVAFRSHTFAMGNLDRNLAAQFFIKSQIHSPERTSSEHIADAVSAKTLW